MEIGSFSAFLSERIKVGGKAGAPARRLAWRATRPRSLTAKWR